MKILFRLLPSAFCLLVAGAVSAEEAWHYDAKGRCDPFYALVQEGKVVPCEANIETGGGGPAGPLQLGGILWDAGGRSLALINGEEVRVGDAVSGYEVSEIHQDRVILTRGGESIVLRMQYEEEGTL